MHTSCRWVNSNPKHLLAQACGYPTRPVKKKARMPDHVEHDERCCWHELEDQDKPTILGEIHSSKPSLEGSAILTDPWTKLWKHIATVHEEDQQVGQVGIVNYNLWASTNAMAQISGSLFVNKVKYYLETKDGVAVGFKNTSSLMLRVKVSVAKCISTLLSNIVLNYKIREGVRANIHCLY
ncbi:hypothetical protein GQ55_2G102900 [Panicum hallii var. hallii]|uniref:Uncharacterized protein n=1 Tax=Panicum hallii var. hallii TaxID=1504633 RepID=A0A2T7ENG3_9POAL|nr:hypothetical protein GQ55_2G102900 [Panicum hallii var. hallii]